MSCRSHLLSVALERRQLHGMRRAASSSVPMNSAVIQQISKKNSRMIKLIENFKKLLLFIQNRANI